MEAGAIFRVQPQLNLFLSQSLSLSPAPLAPIAQHDARRQECEGKEGREKREGEMSHAVCQTLVCVQRVKQTPRRGRKEGSCRKESCLIVVAARASMTAADGWSKRRATRWHQAP